MALSPLDDVSVVAQRQIPMDQTVQKTVDTPQLQIVEQIVETAEMVTQLVEVPNTVSLDRTYQ